MSASATVIMPTHDHGRLIHSAVRSVLAQSYTDFELLVIGDGVPDETRTIMEHYQREDSRVIFFDFPKGPRFGEIYRHQILTTKARGAIVAYAADDDIWLSCHLADMATLLESADFAQGLRISWLDRDTPFVENGNLSVPGHREELLAGRNFIGLANAAHTMELYRRLPYGWRTTPSGTPADWYMWHQILSVDDCRAASGMRPTVINLPQLYRNDWVLEQRESELLRWLEFSQRPDAVMQAAQQMIMFLIRRRAELEKSYKEWDRGNAWLKEQVLAWEKEANTAKAEAAGLLGQLQKLREDITWLEKQRIAWRQQAEANESEIERVTKAYAESREAVAWLERERLAWAQQAKASNAEYDRLMQTLKSEGPRQPSEHSRSR